MLALVPIHFCPVGRVVYLLCQNVQRRTVSKVTEKDRHDTSSTQPWRSCTQSRQIIEERSEFRKLAFDAA